jgi:tetratricopeptide (TPR) repeat protein
MGVLGTEHPDTAKSYNNIGLVYSAQGEYGEAERHYNKVLAIYTRVFDESHPDVQMVRGNLARLDATRGSSAPG